MSKNTSKLSFFSVYRDFVFKSVKFWTIYVIVWSSYAIGLMLLFLPFFKILEGGFYWEIILLYLLAIFIFFSTKLYRTYFHSYLKNFNLNFSTDAKLYFIISLNLAGFIIYWIYGSDSSNIIQMIYKEFFRYSDLLARLFIYTLAASPLIVFAGYKYSDNVRKNGLGMDFVFISFFVGAIISAFLGPFFSYDNLINLKELGLWMAGSIPLWLVRLLLFGK